MSGSPEEVSQFLEENDVSSVAKITIISPDLKKIVSAVFDAHELEILDISKTSIDMTYRPNMLIKRLQQAGCNVIFPTAPHSANTLNKTTIRSFDLGNVIIEGSCDAISNAILDSANHSILENAKRIQIISPELRRYNLSLGVTMLLNKLEELDLSKTSIKLINDNQEIGKFLRLYPNVHVILPSEEGQ